MQRILSGFGITGSQMMLASEYRAAFGAAAATCASASAAMGDFRSGNWPRSSAPTSTASAPSMRPQLVTPLIAKLANFIGCPDLWGWRCWNGLTARTAIWVTAVVLEKCAVVHPRNGGA